MNGADPHSADICFTAFALQEYVLGRLADDVRADLEGHLPTCPECEGCVDLIRRETALVGAALGVQEEAGARAEIDDEMLSLYLGDGLDAEQRMICEESLVLSRALRERLVSLRNQLKALCEEDAASGIKIEVPLAGRILRMPKRKTIPRLFTDLSVEDSEAADG